MKRILRDYLGLILLVVGIIGALTVMYVVDDYYNNDQYKTPTQVIEFNK